VAAHVGDSRVYRLRGTTIEQLTFDHSLVWEMAAAGQASEDEVPAYVPKNVITRSLGPHPMVKVDLEGPHPLKPGDRFLLCSDGLTGPLNPTLIGMVLSSLPPDEAAQTLVDLANLLGGPDNITVVVAEVSGVSARGKRECEHGNGGTVSAGSGFTNTDMLVLLGEIGAALLTGWGLSRGSIALAACGGLTAVALLALWLYQRFVRQTEGAAGGPGRAACNTHGKGPYRRYSVAPSADNIEMLSDIVRQLEDLEDQRTWPFDWKEIHEDRGRALRAIASSDYSAAVVAYSSAVRRLMQAVRDSRPPGATDSGINLGHN
jgi:hypothetical protein